MSQTPVFDATTPSPADEVKRVFHGFMGHHPGVFHFPAQNPYASDYYGDGGGGVYYPHHPYSKHKRGFRPKYGLVDPSGYGYGDQVTHRGHSGGAGPDPYAYGGGPQSYGSAGAATYHDGGGAGHYSASGGGGHGYQHSAAGGGYGGGGGHQNYHAPIIHHPPPPAVHQSRSHKSSKSNSASMSALTLLAFLFFLNILQSCLKEHMMTMNPTVMVMTAGTASRSVAPKNVDDAATSDEYGDQRLRAVQPDQSVYAVFPSSDVQVNDKMKYDYEHEAMRSFNKTIMAKLTTLEARLRRDGN